MPDSTVGTAETGAFPNSAGMGLPRSGTVPKACDAHFHVLDPRFPTPETTRPDGTTFADYRAIQARLGTTRGVIVQAKYHRTDPACLLDALARLGPDGRGVAVVHPEVQDAELRRLDAGGVRGLRFSVWNPADTVTTVAMIRPLARRIADLGWHAQIHMSGAQILAHADLLAELPCPIVIDHMGRLPPREGPDHPAFGVIARLIDGRRTWVKLSGAYLNTEQGPPDYADATRIARSFVGLAPERLVWGSDWPHVTEPHKPDDAVLFDLLAEWAGSGRQRDRILVDNPAELYCFG
ncbi:amidohydrolase family protein [Methylobacterium sp. EM32]|uniref:amidohydrolase family protein n=1 Tax=Methylobacterium sp. EM32 TaxID=3163481 RepID=UPI0033A86A63